MKQPSWKFAPTSLTLYYVLYPLAKRTFNCLVYSIALQCQVAII